MIFSRLEDLFGVVFLMQSLYQCFITSDSPFTKIDQQYVAVVIDASSFLGDDGPHTFSLRSYGMFLKLLNLQISSTFLKQEVCRNQ